MDIEKLVEDLQDYADGLGAAPIIVHDRDELSGLLVRAATALHSAQVPDGVAWRDQYRIQTAMRYMDNAPRLTLDEAYRMADHDIRGLERAAATVAAACGLGSNA